jgi:ribosome-binding factor A
VKVQRTLRLDSEYKKEISNILNTSFKTQCPNVSGLISVTEVSVAPDLKNAKVLLSIYAKDNETKKRTFETIRENAGFIRHELSQVMRMRTVPLLEFFIDDSIEYGAHMDDLFRKIHVEDKENKTEE